MGLTKAGTARIGPDKNDKFEQLNIYSEKLTPLYGEPITKYGLFAYVTEPGKEPDLTEKSKLQGWGVADVKESVPKMVEHIAKNKGFPHTEIKEYVHDVKILL